MGLMDRSEPRMPNEVNEIGEGMMPPLEALRLLDLSLDLV